MPTAAFEVLGRGDQPGLTAPYVIKAPRQGSSVGVHIIHDTAHVPAALEDCFQFGDEVLVEDFVKGRELTIGILAARRCP